MAAIAAGQTTLTLSNLDIYETTFAVVRLRTCIATGTRRHVVMILSNVFVLTKPLPRPFKLGGVGVHKGPRMRMDRRNRQREIWRVEMLATGNLLLDALELERYLKVRYLRKPEDDLLAQWEHCRRTVNRLAKDYAVAIGRYRTGIRSRFAVRIGT